MGNPSLVSGRGFPRELTITQLLPVYWQKWAGGLLAAAPCLPLVCPPAGGNCEGATGGHPPLPRPPDLILQGCMQLLLQLLLLFLRLSHGSVVLLREFIQGSLQLDHIAGDLPQLPMKIHPVQKRGSVPLLFRALPTSPFPRAAAHMSILGSGCSPHAGSSTQPPFPTRVPRQAWSLGQRSH